MSLAWFLTNVAHVCPPPRRSRVERMYFCTVRLLILMPSFKSSPRIRSAPDSRFFLAISPDQADRLGGDPAFDAPGSGSPTPEHPKAIAMPPQEGLGLHNGQSAAPCGQDCGCDEEPKPVERREPREPRLPPQDDDLMPQHRVLDDELPSGSNNVGRHPTRDARPAVGGKRPPHGAGSQPDPVNEVPREVHLQLRPRSR
jgi:hypothetical protein